MANHTLSKVEHFLIYAGLVALISLGIPILVSLVTRFGLMFVRFEKVQMKWSSVRHDHTAQRLVRGWDARLQTTNGYILRELRVAVGSVAERYAASSAWLFLHRSDGELLPLVVHNGSNLPSTINTSDSKSVVAWVARMQEGLCVPDVTQSSLYLCAQQQTKAEIAVPLIAASGELLGVLNLESHIKEQFSPGQLANLQIEAQRCNPLMHLLAFMSCNKHYRCNWFFPRDGWDISHCLADLCEDACTLLEKDGARPTCTVWEIDAEKQVLFARATSGYDEEYRVQSLPMDSYTGSLLKLPKGAVRRATLVQVQDAFLRIDKAEALGVRRLVSASLVTGPGTENAIGVVSFYFFDDIGNVSDAFVVEFAKILTRAISFHNRVRPKVMREHFEREILSCCSSPTVAESVVQFQRFLFSAFGSDGCSLFAIIDKSTRLECISTSGLDHGSTGLPVTNYREAFYDLSDITAGMTHALVKNLGRPVRKNDTPDEREPGAVGLPVAPVNKYRERFGLSASDHRRFLGVGVEDPDELGKVLGVIRLNRSSQRKPFRKEDGECLAALAPTFVKLVQDFARQEQFQSSRSSAPAVEGSAVHRAYRLFGPLSEVAAGSLRSLAQPLHDLIEMFDGLTYKPLSAAISEVVSRDDGRDLTVYACHSVEKNLRLDFCKSVEVSPSNPNTGVANALRAAEENLLVTYRKPTCGFIEQFHSVQRPAFGICIPLLLWNYDPAANKAGLSRWTISLEFGKDFQLGNPELFALMSAARVVGAFINRTRISILPADGLTEPIEGFVDSVRDRLKASFVKLEVPSGPHSWRGLCQAGRARNSLGSLTWEAGHIDKIGAPIEVSSGPAPLNRLALTCGPWTIGRLTIESEAIQDWQSFDWRFLTSMGSLGESLKVVNFQQLGLRNANSGGGDRNISVFEPFCEWAGEKSSR